MNEKILNQVYAYIDSKKDEIIQELIALASIKSVSDEKSVVKPFGQGCMDVLECMLEKGNIQGFKTRNYENYVGCIELDNGASDSIGLWSHLDVVPEGEDWLTPPYSPTVKDGFLFGRGVGDNKSAAIGVFFIQQALRDLNIQTKHKIQLYLGTNEEVGMKDVEYFVKNYEAPKFSLVPDAGFPGVCGEFGRVRYILKSRNKLSSQVKELGAGMAFNIIPNYAYVVLENNKIDLESISSDYQVTQENNCIKIEAFGKSSHAAFPEGGINAIHQLTTLLCKLNLCENDREIFEFMTHVNDDFYGTFLGINKTDDISGQTVSSGTILRLNDGYVELFNDCRHCVTDTNEKIIEMIQKKSDEFHFDVEIVEKSKPSYIDSNGEIVQTITKIYQDYTGNEHKMFIGKGGTYAGQIPNAIATGIVLKGKNPKPEYIKPGHGGAHQPDELLPIDGYIEGIKLLATILLNVDEII